jgi:glycosyltransferase involved in cell wall biosynthesis
MNANRFQEPVVVACPDARPPAYQAVVGLTRAKMLRSFVTSAYYNPNSRCSAVARRLLPAWFGRRERVLLRRHHPEIPPDRVVSVLSFDLALRLEGRIALKAPPLKRSLARWRTEQFDKALANFVDRARPESLLVFSDVGSAWTLPLCRRLGIKTVLSMVHGDVRSEQRVLEQESAAAAEFMPIYLGDGTLDRSELAWLHARRLRDLELADRVVVPSAHIADTLLKEGVPPERVRVIPYAADCRRFHPLPGKIQRPGCTFLFAGGITHRKGIKYLLEAWLKVRRPGWKLQLLGALPRDITALGRYLDLVEVLGRVAHAEMPARMAAADVFVFPSLFEGSAVVTYEALACGLPSVVTPCAGSVVRDGLEGFIVPEGDVDALAARMEQLGSDPELRASMSRAARARALCFDWPRYHADLISVIEETIAPQRRRPWAQPARAAEPELMPVS